MNPAKRAAVRVGSAGVSRSSSGDSLILINEYTAYNIAGSDQVLHVTGRCDDCGAAGRYRKGK